MKKFYEIAIAKENIFINNKLYMKKGKKEFIRDFTPNGKKFYLQDLKTTFDLQDTRFDFE